jgi:hypothetical protein
VQPLSLFPLFKQCTKKEISAHKEEKPEWRVRMVVMMLFSVVLLSHVRLKNQKKGRATTGATGGDSGARG